ncbi:hypothetical protein Arno162_69 [Pectobacterium phage Arno162]|uniref:Uncharacterized protein n=2 Tax=Arnovirus TaxID=3425109 RepID=A0A679A2S8_9CAUD|nr:hypothetical protein Arno162_69 [Pectobacterium phage Arno162]AZV02255.1 hypothetical protein Arno18_69 [Pectobacterium phage Arno18]
MKKKFAICFPSGTVLFYTDSEQTVLNRSAFGWLIKEL